MSTPDLARAALTLLERTDLKGGEVDVYLAVRAWLHDLSRPGAGLDQPAPTQEKPEAGDGE